MKKSKRTLTPKLRFPEFRDAEGWKHKLVGPYLEDCSSRVSASTRLPVYSSTREGLKRQDAYFNGIELLNKNEYGVVPHGCFVYRHMSDDGLFKFNINNTGGDIAVSKEYPVFRTKDLNSLFLLNMLNESPEFKQFAFSQKMGGTRTRLYFKKLCGWKTLLPSLPEQQKIAECLNSLDGLIAAEGRKLAALRDHKRGLMQQLFPQPGQTQPRLRFPEFRDKGEWVERELSELLPIGSSKRVHQRDWARDGVPFYRAREIVAIHNGEQISPLYISEKLYAENVAKTGAISGGDLLVTGVGSIGVPYLVKPSDRFYFKDGNIIWLKNDESELIGPFLHLLYQTSYVQSQITKMAGVGTVGTYTIDNAKRTQVVFPCEPTEQRKVTNCISILDSLITAQTAKIETLKQHKRGLRQQLFPAPEEQ